MVRPSCGEPEALTPVYLTETFADGGVIRLKWKTGWRGEYRFDGLEPGADLVLWLDPYGPGVQLPRLAPGQRYPAQDLPALQGC